MVLNNVHRSGVCFREACGELENQATVGETSIHIGKMIGQGFDVGTVAINGRKIAEVEVSKFFFKVGGSRSFVILKQRFETSPSRLSSVVLSKIA